MWHKLNKWFFPNDTKKDHFYALDGLRGLAVLLVLLSHSSNAGLFFQPYLNFSGAGKMGVYLFFILSAYLLDRQIAVAISMKSASMAFWKNYFLRRFLRVYPLFFIALVFFFLLSSFGYTTAIDQISDIPLHLILIKGESIFWSIPVEFKYYFLSPIIVYSCHKYFLFDIRKTTLFFLFVVAILIFLDQVFEFSSISTLRYFPVFLVGTWLSIFELSNVINSKKPYKIELLGIMGVMLIIFLVTPLFKSTTGWVVDFEENLFLFPFAMLWGGILYATKYGIGILKKIFELKVLRFIGTISFSLYLFHTPILKAVSNDVFGIPQQFKIYLFFILAIVFSCVTYLIIERPIMRIRFRALNSNFQNQQSK
jgi:peptidoglycan/LPS O-acetylase OafA/YrhL